MGGDGVVVVGCEGGVGEGRVRGVWGGGGDCG